MNIEEETYEEAVIRAEYTYEWLKDKVHDQYEEIERQKEIIRQLDIKNLELTSIIKEVREYIGLSDELRKLCTNYDVNGIGILEILDKEK